VARLGDTPLVLNHLAERPLVLIDLLRGGVLREMRQRILEPLVQCDIVIHALQESGEGFGVRVHRLVAGRRRWHRSRRRSLSGQIGWRG
jgi:hypothetical protein